MSCEQSIEPLWQLLWFKGQVLHVIGPTIYQTTDLHGVCTINLSNNVHYLTSVMGKYKAKASPRYRTTWLCFLPLKYQQTGLFVSWLVIKCYHRDCNARIHVSPLGNLYGCFNHITGDAGVMLLLLDLIYSACQMLIWYHYYCQKRIYFYFFTCAVIAALYSFCMCVCVCVLLHAALEMMVLRVTWLCPGKERLNSYIVCCMSFLKVYFIQENP